MLLGGQTKKCKEIKTVRETCQSRDDPTKNYKALEEEHQDQKTNDKPGKCWLRVIDQVNTLAGQALHLLNHTSDQVNILEDRKCF
jgi:hypothetical protein